MTQRARHGECCPEKMKLKWSQFTCKWICFTVWSVRRWTVSVRSWCRYGREIGHEAPLKPCAANQLQSVPHPYKDSLMSVRPLNLTAVSHKASLALIWVRRNVMLFLTTKPYAQQQNACLPDIQTIGNGVYMCLYSVTGKGKSKYQCSPPMIWLCILYVLLCQLFSHYPRQISPKGVNKG